MNDLKEMDSTSNTLIPNEAGLPSQSKSAQKLRSGLHVWKSENRKKEINKSSTLSYWQTVSSCSAL